MKLLCLHGYGTNAECLRSQLLPTLNALGGEHECVFIEGELSVGKSVFTGNFDPPYRAYYEDSAAAGMVEAHRLVEEAIEFDGPFDGIVGFSQGAGLGISYLLHQRITDPSKPSPFKFGLFFSTSFASSPDPLYKQDEVTSCLKYLTDADIQEFHVVVQNPVSRQEDLDNCSFMKNLPVPEKALFRELAWELCSAFQTRNDLHIKDKVDLLESLKASDVPRESFPRFFNPIYTTERLNIPTVHSMGRNDSERLRRLAFIARDLCSDGMCITFEHGGRHELPMKRDETMIIANAVEKAYYIGQQMAVAV